MKKMKKVGIIGGLGPESTVEYYKAIIHKFQLKLGNKTIQPELYINSIDMYKMFDYLNNDDTPALIDYLANEVQKLTYMGADFVVLSANTPHIVFQEVQEKAQVPMISLVQETCLKAKETGLKRVGLLGTRFTMENDFFKIPFDAAGIEIKVPEAHDQAYIHRKITEELEYGIIQQSTKQAFLEIIRKMVTEEQIQGVILGCTELPLLIKDEDLEIYQFNTTEIHVDKILEEMLEEEEVVTGRM